MPYSPVMTPTVEGEPVDITGRACENSGIVRSSVALADPLATAIKLVPLPSDLEPAGRACQFFCVWGLEVGGDSVGVGGGELGEGLFPVGGGVSLDEAGVSCSFVGGFPGVCEALGGSFVFDVADGEPQEFDGGFFAGEMPAVLGDFT